MRGIFVAVSLGVVSWAGAQASGFQASDRFIWGAGDNLPAPYTQLDMLVTIRMWAGFIPLPAVTQEGGVEEAAYVKTAGQLGFSLNTQALNPTLPPLILSVAGAATGNQVTWNFDQTFTGSYPLTGVFNINGVPTNISITVTNPRVTGMLRANFAATPPFSNPLSVTPIVNQGFYTGGDPVNFINIRPSSASGTVPVPGIGNLNITRLEVDLRRIQHVFGVPAPSRIIVGTLGLEAAANRPLSEPAQWHLLDGIGTVLASGTTTLGPTGQYSVTVADTSAGRHLRLRVPGYLARKGAVNLSVAPGATLNLTLPTGDPSLDGEVGPADFSVVLSQFGSETPSTGPWNSGDVNRDGEVGPTDFSLVLQNFGSEDQ